MEPTGSGDDIITNSVHVMCQFILSCRKRCFFISPNSSAAADLRVEFDKIVITLAKRRSLDQFFFFFGRKGGRGGRKPHRAEPWGGPPTMRYQSRALLKVLFIISKFSLQVLIRVWHEKII